MEYRETKFEFVVRRRIHEGQDVELPDEEIPYKVLRNLGHGGHGLVEEVKDTITGACFARKTFKFFRWSEKDAARTMLYEEVKTIRALAQHPHIIRVHASYVTTSSLAIILHPVADRGDLAHLLSYIRKLPRYHPEREKLVHILERAFGCLAHCLAYIHSDKFGQKPIIRHKDIKPSNILIHQDYAILTDFGVSKPCMDGNTTTEGKPKFLTKRYCAPEVADYDSRNRKADIFSLGCVFFEMMLILWPDQFPNISTVSNSIPYHEQLEDIHYVLNACLIPDLPAVVKSMLRRAAANRPSAGKLLDEIQGIQEIRAMPGCQKCFLFDNSAACKVARRWRSVADPPLANSQPDLGRILASLSLENYQPTPRPSLPHQDHPHLDRTPGVPRLSHTNHPAQLPGPLLQRQNGTQSQPDIPGLNGNRMDVRPFPLRLQRPNQQSFPPSHEPVQVSRQPSVSTAFPLLHSRNQQSVPPTQGLQYQSNPASGLQTDRLYMPDSQHQKNQQPIGQLPFPGAIQEFPSVGPNNRAIPARISVPNAALKNGSFASFVPKSQLSAPKKKSTSLVKLKGPNGKVIIENRSIRGKRLNGYGYGILEGLFLGQRKSNSLSN